MNFSELKRIPMKDLINIEKEKTDDKKIEQNIAFAQLKARALKNEVGTYPARQEQFFRSIPTDEALADPIRNLLLSLTPLPKSLK